MQARTGVSADIKDIQESTSRTRGPCSVYVEPVLADKAYDCRKHCQYSGCGSGRTRAGADDCGGSVCGRNGQRRPVALPGSRRGGIHCRSEGGGESKGKRGVEQHEVHVGRVQNFRGDG